jgi:hypothetical protein
VKLLIILLVLTVFTTHAYADNRILLVGDSVLASLKGYVEKSLFNSNYIIDAKVCRRSTTPGCMKGAEKSALDVLRNLTNKHNTIIVIMIGHNDDRGVSFQKKIQLLLEELHDVPKVFWITMREVSQSHIVANQIIIQETNKFSHTHIIPWHNISRQQHSWVTRDGTHLTPIGSKNLAIHIRQLVGF